MATQNTAPVISGIEALADNYDVFLCDVWGVLHNGVHSFAPAVDALVRFRKKGGTVVLVSNAPRPGRYVLPQLEQLGVTKDAFDAIMTSGDISREAVEERSGQTVYHIGPERDLSLYNDTDTIQAPLEEADYIVCTGLFNDETETVENYRETLDVARRRNLWMLCANPDLVVDRGNKLIVCAGSIAAAYESMGADVYWAGKPHRPIYEKAINRAADILEHPVEKKRVMAIGDAIRTDIAGAVNFGIDALMVARGIHGHELGVDAGDALIPERAIEWLSKQAIQPTAIIDYLSW
ncbi:TIGR01459 family HAD-type hydrolase [Microvirga sp. W0021]|uniref:TIGR01459 family HAD-type hydrolase n=1 Tax=Hohaiivirga grylli TaxID=3133970 RepID=A0ABV0BGA6_9HYPH